MAVDTRQKRFSLLNFSWVPSVALFEADGAVDADDRAHLLNLYSGIALSAGAITGTGAGTLAAVTGAATGKVDIITGTGAGTLAAITGSGTGKVDVITGTGAGTLSAITGSGTGTSGEVAEEKEATTGARGGGGKLTLEDRRHIRSELERMYALLSGEKIEAPEEIVKEAAKKAAEIVKPFAKTKARKPKPERVDWRAVSEQAEAVERMIALYEQIQSYEQINQENEDAAILLLLAA